MNRGVEVLQTFALPLGYDAVFAYFGMYAILKKNGADYGARTRHLDLGKVALYQMS